MVTDFQAVVLGGDIGAYSLARAFHEAYEHKSIVLSTMDTGLVRDSVFIENQVHPDLEDPQQLVTIINSIAEPLAAQGRKVVALGSADWLVRLLVENREKFAGNVVVPYASLELLDLVTDKTSFAELCQQYQIAHPQTVVVDFSTDETPAFSELRFPVIAKTADTAAYHQVEFAGKKKVFLLDNQEDLDQVLAAVRSSGYQDKFLVQDYIPGDDSGMRILTCYSDPASKVQFGVSGRVLVEEHTPGALGNPAGIIVDYDAALVAQITRLLEGIGWVGYANFDLKFDPRTGETVCFELNPRLGRSNFYLSAAGANPIPAYIQDWVRQEPAEYPRPETLDTHLYTVLPLRLLGKYVFNKEVRRELKQLKRAKRVTNALRYRAERQVRRLAYVEANQLNQFRKFRRFYPVAVAQQAYDSAQAQSADAAGSARN